MNSKLIYINDFAVLSTFTNIEGINWSKLGINFLSPLMTLIFVSFQLGFPSRGFKS